MVPVLVVPAQYNPLAILTGPWCRGLVILVFALTTGGLPGCLQAGGPPHPTTTVQSDSTQPVAKGTATPPTNNPASSTGPVISGPVTRPAVTPGAQRSGTANVTPAPTWKPGDPVLERQDLRRSN
jgi:hypothetical protein